MKAHLPWGHPGYTMTVELTRGEVVDLLDAMGTSTDLRFLKIYEVIREEYNKVMEIEAALLDPKEYRVTETFTYHVMAESGEAAKKQVLDGLADNDATIEYQVEEA